MTDTESFKGSRGESSEKTPILVLSLFPMVLPPRTYIYIYLDPPVQSQDPICLPAQDKSSPYSEKVQFFVVVNQIKKELLGNLHRSRIVYWIYFNFSSLYCSIGNNFLAISHSYGERLHWAAEQRFIFIFTEGWFNL